MQIGFTILGNPMGKERASKKVKQAMKNENILPTCKPNCDNVFL